MKNWYSISSLARSLEAPYTVIHSGDKSAVLLNYETGEIVAREIEEAEMIVKGGELTCLKIEMISEEPELLPA